MSKYNPEGSLPIIDELQGYSGATVIDVAEPNWYISKVKTVPDNPTHQVLQISQTKLAEVLPRKEYIIDKSAAYPQSEYNEVKLHLNKLKHREEINISKFDTKVNNNKLEAINPDKEVNYVSRDSSKAWYSIIWDYVYMGLCMLLQKIIS